MPSKVRITPCLWFDTQAEQAANYYIGIFKNSKITDIGRYSEAGKEIHGREAGSVMIVEFELDGQTFTALNGGPHFKFNEAVSLQVRCKDQAEVDYFWEKLSAGGDPRTQQCGWLKDMYGLSWQIVPSEFFDMISSGAPQKVNRTMAAMMAMKKLDLTALRRAFEGE